MFEFLFPEGSMNWILIIYLTIACGSRNQTWFPGMFLFPEGSMNWILIIRLTIESRNRSQRRFPCMFLALMAL